jgi:hypothetical protein
MIRMSSKPLSSKPHRAIGWAPLRMAAHMGVAAVVVVSLQVVTPLGVASAPAQPHGTTVHRSAKAGLDSSAGSS